MRFLPHDAIRAAPTASARICYAIIGDPVAHGRAGFAFSSALQADGGDWTFEKMDDWLKSPRAFASGTKMSFAGLSKPEDRANVIAYLNAQGSNLPLPAVEAAPAAEEPAAAEGEEAPAEGEAAATAAAESEPAA